MGTLHEYLWYSYDNIFLHSYQDEKYFRQNLQRKSKQFYFQKLFVENRAVYEVMWGNTVEPDRPQMAIKYGAKNMRFACPITKATDTQSLCYCFSTATVVTRTRLNVALYVHCRCC